MINYNLYPRNNLIEDTLTGNRHSALALTRSICFGTDSERLSSELEARLSNIQSADQPIYVKCCQILLQARNQETYLSAKKTLKASLNETNQDFPLAQLMLIYIKVFSPKKEKAAPQITEKFLKEIENVKQTGDCFSEIEIKEEFLEYLLNHSLNPVDVEKGLQLQLSLLHNLGMMNFWDCNIAELTDRQLKRYLDLIIKYFGGEDQDQEQEVKKTLEAAKSNSLLSDHQRFLADYHLANLLLIKEFAVTCDLPEAEYLLKNLLKKLDKENPYYLYTKFLTTSLLNEKGSFQLSLASMINHKDALDLKAEILYELGLSYIEDYQETSNTFDADIEKTWLYLNKALESAHCSSFLIPQIRLKLGALFLLRKKNERNQDLEAIRKHLDILANQGNFEINFKNEVKFLLEIMSGLTKGEPTVSSKCDESNLILDNFKMAQLIGRVYPSENSIKTKTKLIELLNTKDRLSSFDLILEFESHLHEVKTEIDLSYFDVADLKIEIKELKRNLVNSNLRIDYEIQYKKFAEDLHKLISSLPETKKIEAYDHINKIIEMKLIKLQQDCHLSPTIWSKRKTHEIQLGIHNYFIELLEKDSETKKQVHSCSRQYSSIAQDYINELKEVTNSQEDLIFLINCYKIRDKNRKIFTTIPSDRGLAHSYLSLADFCSGKPKSDLLWEAGRIYYQYYSHLESFGDKSDIFHNYFYWEKRTNNELGYVQLSTDAFLCANDDLNKYYCMGLEILNFGPRLILEYIKEHHSYKGTKLQRSNFPPSLFSLFLNCVELLRFHNREEEANELLDIFQTLPNLDSYLTSIFKPQKKCKGIEKHRPVQSGSVNNNNSQDISIGNHAFTGGGFLIDHSNKKFNFKKYPNLEKQIETAEGLDWLPYFDLTFSVIHKSEKPTVNEAPRRVKKNKRNQEISSSSPEINEKEVIASGEIQEPSLTSVIKKQAQAALENQERKKRLKEARDSKQIMPMTSGASPNINHPEEPPFIYLTPKGMSIFDKLWEKNGGALNSQNDLFDPHDYRNDVAITKEEVKKLIEELGGEYHEDQGKGSHNKGVIPSLCNSPKIILGKSSMTFADFGSTPSSQNVTLTKSHDLKYYQVFQLRDKLIKLGYTPKTVREKS